MNFFGMSKTRSGVLEPLKGVLALAFIFDSSRSFALIVSIQSSAVMITYFAISAAEVPALCCALNLATWPGWSWSAPFVQLVFHRITFRQVAE